MPNLSITMFCPMTFPQTALQTDEPGCSFKTDVTILSMEKKRKSKAILSREQKPSAKALVRNFNFVSKTK